MCGIAGVIDLAGTPVEEDRLRRCCEVLRHRGPDDEGVWRGQAGSASVGLAHTRLAVIDTSSGGRQPMISADGRWIITYNGELYNYRELREELRSLGASFRSQSDTEVVLAAIAAWGKEAFAKFNGMWALCAIDLESGTGMLCRDRFGVKPLYYAGRGKRLIFGSELRAVRRLEDGIDEIDPEAIEEYLCLGFIGHPRTVFRGVRKLSPGHLLGFDANGVGVERRWYRPEVIPYSEPTARGTAAHRGLCERLREQVRDAVRMRTVADVPVGSFLSGGLDSSVVVGHLARLGGTVRTFTIGYAEEPQYDETRYARSAAERLGTEHHEIVLTYEDILKTLVAAFDHLSEPFGDSSLLPTMMVSEFARRTVTVVLSGDGADELFGGYWRYAAHGYLRKYHRVPRLIRRFLLEPVGRRIPSAKSSVLGNRVRQFRKLVRATGRDRLADHAAWSMILAPEARGLLGPEWDAEGYLSRACDRLAAGRSWGDPAERDEDPLNYILGCDVGYSLPADMLHKVDIASMCHGLEVRVPMLDFQVAELAAGIPSDLKRGGGMGKRLLADAHADMLPEDILRRSKMGFEVPIGEFLRVELRDVFLGTVTKPLFDRLGIPGFETALRVYDEHCRRRAEHADLLYAVLVLCNWAERELK